MRNICEYRKFERIRSGLSLDQRTLDGRPRLRQEILTIPFHITPKNWTLGSRDKLLIVIIILTNFTTIKKIFSKTAITDAPKNYTKIKSKNSQEKFHDKKPSLDSLDLKSKQLQNVSLTWNPRRSVLTPRSVTF